VFYSTQTLKQTRVLKPFAQDSAISHPGGNATGVTFILDELASKRLELLKEAAPRISRVGFLWNPEHPDNEYSIAQDAARKIGGGASSGTDARTG
jgi:hypothetical protein